MRLSCRNCRGIASLDADLEMRGGEAIIYASNGTFKTSLLRTLANYATGREQSDLLHPEKSSSFEIDDGSEPIPRDCVHAILPPDGLAACRFFDSTMLASPDLKRRYQEASEILSNMRDSLLSAIAPALKTTKRPPSTEELASFIGTCSSRGSFYEGLSELVEFAKTSPELSYLDGVAFQDLFTKSKRGVISKEGVAEHIEEYASAISSMLNDVHFLSEGFSYRDLNALRDAVKNTTFFDEGHYISFHDKATGQEIRCDTLAALNDLVEREVRRVFESEDVQSKFESVSKAIGQSKAAQDLVKFLGNNPLVLAKMSSPRDVERDFYVKAIRDSLDLAEEVVRSYDSTKEELRGIRSEINAESSEWERAIGIFKARFSVPFDLEVTNRADVVLGDAVPALVFRYEGEAVERDALFECLSNGERNAMFLLHVIFEIERIEWADGRTQYLFFDDPVDSFDYKNKYGFVEYLRDFAERDAARVVVLTHNYDFLRAVSSRLGNKFMRSDVFLCEDAGNHRLSLRQAHYLGANVLTRWRVKVAEADRVATVAAIPFVRELCEIKEGRGSDGYRLISDALHGRAGGELVELSSLYGLFDDYLGVVPSIDDAPVQDLCLQVCREIVRRDHLEDEALLEGKVVLSMGIRILAERKLVGLWNEAGLGGEPPKKYGTLWRRIKNVGRQRLESLGVDASSRNLFERVALVTPANIHVNSFMYEPLIDTSEWQLVELFRECLDL